MRQVPSRVAASLEDEAVECIVTGQAAAPRGAARRGTALDDGSRWYRIGELEKLSGVSRRNVHFYLEKGLLHPPRRTGRTMAYYDDAHVAKLEFIRAARSKATPLFAIKEQLAERFASQSSPRAPSAGAAVKERRGRPGGRSDMRARILDLGCELFCSNGFRATVVSDITSRLGVGKGTFYFYFADKDDLFLECIPRIFQNLFADSWDKMRRERNPLRRLELRAKAVLPVLDEFWSILALCTSSWNASMFRFSVQRTYAAG